MCCVNEGVGKPNLGHCRILTHQVRVSYDQFTLPRRGCVHIYLKERFLARDAKEFPGYPENQTMHGLFNVLLSLPTHAAPNPALPHTVVATPVSLQPKPQRCREFPLIQISTRDFLQQTVLERWLSDRPRARCEGWMVTKDAPPQCSRAPSVFPFPLSYNPAKAFTITPLSLGSSVLYSAAKGILNPVKFCFLHHEMGPPWPNRPAPPYSDPATVPAFPSLSSCTYPELQADPALSFL